MRLHIFDTVSGHTLEVRKVLDGDAIGKRALIEEALQTLPPGILQGIVMQESLIDDENFCRSVSSGSRSERSRICRKSVASGVYGLSLVASARYVGGLLRYEDRITGL